MSPRVNTEDLIDSNAVARILGLAQASSVFTYQARYPDMPRPVLIAPKCRFWVRQEIEAWDRGRRSFKA